MDDNIDVSGASYIASCNACGVLMWDDNPSDESYKQTETGSIDIEDMATGISHGNTYNCCPKCNDDAHLIDIVVPILDWVSDGR